MVEIVEPDLTNARPSDPSRFDEAEANDQSIGPRVEPVRIAEARKLSPHRDEGLLHGFVRSVRVANDPAGDEIEPSRRRTGQRLIGVAVPPLRPLDQISIHQRRTSWTAPTGRLTVSEAREGSGVQSSRSMAGGHAPGGGSMRPSPQTSGPQKNG